MLVAEPIAFPLWRLQHQEILRSHQWECFACMQAFSGFVFACLSRRGHHFGASGGEHFIIFAGLWSTDALSCWPYCLGQYVAYTTDPNNLRLWCDKQVGKIVVILSHLRRLNDNITKKRQALCLLDDKGKEELMALASIVKAEHTSSSSEDLGNGFPVVGFASKAAFTKERFLP